LLIAFVAVSVVALVVTTIGRSDQAAPATASAAPTDTPTPADRTGGTVIDQAGVTGYWKITATSWGSGSVTLHVAVTVDTGILACQFYAFDNDSAAVLSPLPGGPESLDSTMYVSPGQTLTGSLTFQTTRRDLTLVMSDGDVQLSALSVTA
jgi:hypothetical protein